jgi:GH15 family glucan-1,4-alpha-glucosidase
MPSRIEDYALIGDCETAALVGKDGSIDWLCWPRFDSEACFAGLLGTEENGRWLIAPVDGQATVTRRYRGDSLILETRFETATGSCVVVDVMPPRRGDSNLVRIVYGERGTVQMRTELVIRFGYGAVVPWVHRLADGTLRAIGGPDQIVLRTPVPLEGVDKRTVGEFTISEGQSVPFALSYRASHLAPPDPDDPYEGLADSEKFWTEWSSHASCKDAEEHALMMR